jgi:hypothetical protein
MVANARTWHFASFMLAAALTAPAAAQYGQPNPSPPQMMPGHGQNESSGTAPAAPTAPASASDATAAAACVIGRNATAGNAIFATPPFSAAERAEATRLLNDMRRCSHHPQMVSSPTIIRAAFAEASVETVFPTAPAARNPALGAAPLTRPTDGDAAFLAQVAPMYQLVDCATPREPALARAILATDPGTPGESAAIAALNPTFVSCVAPGSRISIDPRLMRFMFAEALYRWSVVQRDGAASAWAAAPAAAPTAAAAPASGH